MRKATAILSGYLLNAIVSAMVGVLLAFVLAIALGQDSVSLASAGGDALIGILCGTCSRAAIEGAFSLFGESKALAYALNASVTAAVIIFVCVVLEGGFGELGPVAIALIFAVPELASVIVVYCTLNEAASLNKAFARKRRELDD